MSILVYAITRDLHIAITFLVIACPGALVIGAPVSNVAGIGNGAKNGVLVKGGEVMDKFSKVDTLVFDKTGTLTKGKPEVTDIKHLMNRIENELLRLVAQAETISEHHLGQTIVKEAKAREFNLMRMNQKMEKSLKEMESVQMLKDILLAVGNRKLMNTENIDVLHKRSQNMRSNREKAGNTAIFAAVDGKVAGIFSIADQIRDDAPEH